MTALSLPVVLGFAGLATEASLWYAAKRSAQSAADSAAYSAAVINGGTPSQFRNQARAVAATYGFTNGTGGVTVTVNSPPATGPNAGSATAVEVIVQQPQNESLSRLFLRTAPTVYARAVARTANTGAGCVVSLNTGNLIGAQENGTVNVNLNGCDIYDNASGASSFVLNGVSALSAREAHFGGGDHINGGATLTTTNGVYQYQAPIADPYAGTPVPSLTGTNLGSISGNGTFSPGRYSGITLTSGKVANLQPGTYIIDSGSIDIRGGATLNCTSCTIILTSATPSNIGTISVRGGATVNVSAPTTGTYAGIAFFQDPAVAQGNLVSNTAPNSFNGGTTQNITGAIYFPNQAVSFGGGSSTGGSQCTQLVAQVVTFSGNSQFNNSCTGTGTKQIGSTTPALIE